MLYILPQSALDLALNMTSHVFMLCFVSKMGPDLYRSLTQGHKAISLLRYHAPSLILPPLSILILYVVFPLAPRWRSFWHHTQQNHPKGPNRISSGPWHHLVTWGKTFTYLPFVDCLFFFFFSFFLQVKCLTLDYVLVIFPFHF